jgi:hypothetical protein
LAERREKIKEAYIENLQEIYEKSMKKSKRK